MIPVYEDNHLLVVSKEFGVPSQEDPTGDMDMLRIAKEYVRVSANKKGEAYLALVHRLDRVSGGLMIFAKTSKAAARLSDQIRNREMGKGYYAVVEGELEERDGAFEDYLHKNQSKNLVTVQHKNHPRTKYAKLLYRRLMVKDGLSLVAVRLLTGRSHQIRVQFASRSHPLYGDAKYNAQHKVREGIALWSGYLSIRHPVTKAVMEFFLPPPDSAPWNIVTTEAVRFDKDQFAME